MKPQTPEEIFTLQNPQDGKLPHWAKMLTEEHTRQALLYALEDAKENGKVMREKMIDWDTKEKTTECESFWSTKDEFYQIDKSSILSRYESILKELGL